MKLKITQISIIIAITIIIINLLRSHNLFVVIKVAYCKASQLMSKKKENIFPL